MQILITGANGFLGKHIYTFFNQRYDVKGIARNTIKSSSFHCYGANELDDIDFNPDVVIMCHASVSSGGQLQQLDNLFESNVSFTQKVCNRFSESKLIYISTVSVYKNDTILSEDSSISPSTDYAFSKLWGEQIVLQNKYAAVLRISSMYGPGMKRNTIIPFFVEQALGEDNINILGDGSRIQNYIHVNDVIGFLDALIARFTFINNRILLGVTKKEYSNIDLAKMIARFTGCKISLIGEDSSQSFRYNNKQTIAALRYEPRTSLEQGIENYIEWIKKES